MVMDDLGVVDMVVVVTEVPDLMVAEEEVFVLGVVVVVDLRVKVVKED